MAATSIDQSNEDLADEEDKEVVNANRAGPEPPTVPPSASTNDKWVGMMPPLMRPVSFHAMRGLRGRKNHPNHWAHDNPSEQWRMQ